MTGKNYTIFYYFTLCGNRLADYEHITLQEDEDLKQFYKNYDKEIFYIAKGHITNLLEELYPNDYRCNTEN